MKIICDFAGKNCYEGDVYSEIQEKTGETRNNIQFRLIYTESMGEGFREFVINIYLDIIMSIFIKRRKNTWKMA